jgi:hypothetical protein
MAYNNGFGANFGNDGKYIPPDQYRAGQVQAQAEKKAMQERERQRQANAFKPAGFDKQWNTYGDVYGAAGPNRMAGQQFRDTQGALLRQLQADANGNGPGQQLVRMQAQGMADRGGQQQMAMAAGARPGQSAMAGRNAAFNTAGMQSQVGGQAAQAGLQARMGAMSQMGQVAGQARQGDLAQMGLNDQTQLEALRQRMALSGMHQQGAMTLEQMRQQQRQFQQSQPGFWDKAINLGVQGAQTYAATQTGGASEFAFNQESQNALDKM